MSIVQPAKDRNRMASLAAQLMGGTAPNSVQAPAAASPPPYAAKATIPCTLQAPQPPATASQTSLPLNEGPSLYGNAEQLKAAREFLSSATAGAPNSRGGSRHRSLPREPAHRPATRAAATSTTSHRTATASPRRVAAAATPTAPPAMATRGLGQWQALRAQQSTRIESQILPSSSSKAGPSDLQKREHGQAGEFAGAAGQTNAPGLEIPKVGKPAHLLNEMTNPLKDGAADPLPPHLRTKGPSTVAANVKVEAAEDARIVQDVQGQHGSISVPVDIVLELRKEMTALYGRVVDLESECFATQKQLEALLQAEERRKFLGADSSLAPYGIDVQRSCGIATRVQASASLKVGRRIRTKCNISPAQSKNPRVEFNDQQLGHGMTLREAGVKADAVVLFTYND